MIDFIKNIWFLELKMNTPQLFLLFLVISLVIGIAIPIYPILGFHETSEDLEIILSWNGYQEIFPIHKKEEWGVSSFFGVVITSQTVLAYIVGLIGAFLFKKWRRSLLFTLTMSLSLPLKEIIENKPNLGPLQNVSH